VSSLEGVFLIVLTWKSRSRLRSLFRSMRRDPYIAYCFGVMVVLIYLFSSFSNFGILSRQRTQVLPFFLALLCLPVWHREGVIPTEDAIAGRDQPTRPKYDVAPADPYRDALDPRSHDPYSVHDVRVDPYRQP
jgi:hypothetical protein